MRKSLMLLAGMMATAGLQSGCTSHEGRLNEPQGPSFQGVNCDGKPGSPATVTIDLTDPAHFGVSPKKCKVKGGRPVTWTTTADPPHNFVVRFTGATPDPGGETEFEGSRPPGGPHDDAPYTRSIPRVGLHVANGDNEYEYEVYVNGIMIDPSIIIEPN